MAAFILWGASSSWLKQTPFPTGVPKEARCKFVAILNNGVAVDSLLFVALCRTQSLQHVEDFIQCSEVICCLGSWHSSQLSDYICSWWILWARHRCCWIVLLEYLAAPLNYRLICCSSRPYASSYESYRFFVGQTSCCLPHLLWPPDNSSLKWNSHPPFSLPGDFPISSQPLYRCLPRLHPAAVFSQSLSLPLLSPLFLSVLSFLCFYSVPRYPMLFFSQLHIIFSSTSPHCFCPQCVSISTFPPL